MGLLFLIFPDYFKSWRVLPKVTPGGAGISVRKTWLPNWILGIGGFIAIMLGVLEVFGIITLSNV